MRKLLILLVLTTILAVGITPALATPLADLNDLARYFPADTPIFVASRFDDAYFQTLDDLIAKVAEVAPPGSIPPITINQALDQALGDALAGKSFSTDMRPWLGDTVAVGVLEIPQDQRLSSRQLLRPMSATGDAPVIIAIAITDQATATAFITEGMTANDVEFTQTEGDGFTLIEDPEGDGFLVVRDDVVLVSNKALGAGGLPDGSLSSSAAFTGAMDKLPADEYNLSIYANLGDFITEALESDPDTAATVGAMMPLLNAIGPMAVGGTILDGVNLTLDYVVTVDPAAYENSGMPNPANMAPIDPAFAAHVPADAPLAIFGTSLNVNFETMFAQLDLQASMMGDEGEQMQESVAQAETMFTQFTGLDLREDVFSWMTGNYAMFLKLNPELNTSSAFGIFATFPVDFGLAIEATDPAKAAATVEGLTKGIEQAVTMFGSSDEETEVVITHETIVGTDTTVITITAEGAPWPIELLLGANGEVFALGTRNAVQAIFARDGGLPANAVYQNAQTHVLADPYSMAYLGTEGLLPLADLIEASNDDSDTAAIAQSVRDILNLIPSGTLSASYEADGTARGRAVLTLSE